MPIQCDALVVARDRVGPFERVAFRAADLAPQLNPGRFALAEVGRPVREPLFAAGRGEGTFEVLLPEADAAAFQPGASVNLIGPLGRGFEVPSTVRRILLVADIPHLPVLLPLACRSDGAVDLSLLLIAPSDAELYPIPLLPPELELQLVADARALEDDLRELALWAGTICLAARPEFYRPLAEVVREERIGGSAGFAQALIVPPMACGVGACGGCAVAVAGGFKLACTDGPVFDLLELR